MREEFLRKEIFGDFEHEVKASLDKQKYLACADEVVFGDLGIFHAARTGGAVQAVCAVHIGSDVVQYSVIWAYFMQHVQAALYKQFVLYI
jgi:hypothetical protein